MSGYPARFGVSGSGTVGVTENGAVGENRDAVIDAKGVCSLTDWDDAHIEWPSVGALAAQYWADHGRDSEASYGPAQHFVNDLADAGDPAVMGVLQALVDSAASDGELDYVGAGPLEDLLSHSGHGAAFVDEVERRARQDRRFRVAVSGLWLNTDVPEDVRTRLAVYGATLL
jgi:hypothetical protein